jgi:anti-sigma B factor antagonist
MTDVAFDRREDVVVARLSGEIDIATAERLQDAILAEVRSAEEGGLVVDLSDVGFLDSAGIRLLFSVHRSMTESGRPMAIVVPDGARIASVLSIVELPSVVWTAETIAGAVAMLFPRDGGAARRSDGDLQSS